MRKCVKEYKGSCRLERNVLWKIWYAPEGIFHMSFCIITQLALGIAIGEFIRVLKRKTMNEPGDVRNNADT